jgi:hypothetical protein
MGQHGSSSTLRHVNFGNFSAASTKKDARLEIWFLFSDGVFKDGISGKVSDELV